MTNPVDLVSLIYVHLLQYRVHCTIQFTQNPLYLNWLMTSEISHWSKPIFRSLFLGFLNSPSENTSSYRASYLKYHGVTALRYVIVARRTMRILKTQAIVYLKERYIGHQVSCPIALSLALLTVEPRRLPFFGVACVRQRLAGVSPRRALCRDHV